MSLKTAVKQIENRLKVDDDHETLIYDFPNEDGTVDVLHVTSRGSWKETIGLEECNRIWAENREARKNL